MTTVTYSSTALSNGKKGVLKELDSGYYMQPIGALNVFNSAGQFYPLATARHHFEANSVLMRRIQTGNCRGEVGHPKRLPGQSFVEYVARIAQIWEDNVCVHFRKVHLDMSGSWKDREGRPMVAMLGEFCPAGAKGGSLRDAVNNGCENVNFSLRSYTNDVVSGNTMNKHITKIFGWDWVNEPGITIANKWQSPSLESIVDDIPITAELLNSVQRYAQSCGMGMEDSNFDFADVHKVLSDSGHTNIQPIYMGWK